MLNLFGDSIDAFLETEIITSRFASHLSSSDLNHLVVQQAFRPELGIARFKAWITKVILIEALPTTAYFALPDATYDPDFKRFEAMKLHDFEWGQIHAGLSFAQSVGLDIKLSVAEASDLGKMLLAQLKQGSVPNDWWQFFRLPARIRYTQDHPDLIKDTHSSVKADMDVHALHNYAVAHERFLHQHCATLNFSKLMQAYLTRPQLARVQIKEKCPGAPLSTYLNRGTYYCIVISSTEPLLRYDKFYLPAQDDVIIHLPDINALYQTQVDTIAQAYAIVDKLLLIAACNSLPVSEIDFLAAAQISLAQARFSAAPTLNKVPFIGANIHARENLSVDLKHVVFLIAEHADESERIYAFRKDAQGYQMLRVDRDETRYYALLTTDKRPIDNHDFRLYIATVGGPLQKKGEKRLDLVFDNLAKQHQSAFAQHLYDYGVRQTDLKKLTEVMLSFVPFYTCINSLHQGNTAEALLACSMDAVALIPVAGELSMLSAKLWEVVATGGLIAARSATIEMAAHGSLQVALKQGGAEFIQHAILPVQTSLQIDDLGRLGLATLRTLDPGIELSAIVGRTSLRQAVRFAKQMRQSLPHLERLLPRLESALEKMPPRVDLDDIVQARLHGIDKAIDVIKLKTDRYQGQDIYVRIHPETCHPYGRKYLLSHDGVLEPIPIAAGRRLHNLLEQGLGGRGAAAQATHWTKQTQEVTLPILRQVQQGIANGASLEQLSVRVRVTRETILSYISADGLFTARGQQMMDIADASSVAEPLEDRTEQRALAPAPVATAATSSVAIHADQLVRDFFQIDIQLVVAMDDTYGHYFKYDIDLDVFISLDRKLSAQVYRFDRKANALQPMTQEQANARAKTISLDQRTAVIKALDIDLDLAVLSTMNPAMAVEKMALPKIINFIWVGPNLMPDEIVENIRANTLQANTHEYAVHFYLSKQSQAINAKRLSDAVSPRRSWFAKKLFTIEILEDTQFYSGFKTSDSFPQYQDAIEGNQGVATNYASAADILRFSLLKEKGGLYLDVDDRLTNKFGMNPIMAGIHEFALGIPLRSEALGMHFQYGTSMFGCHQGNPVIDLLLQEIRRCYQQPKYKDFYTAARPKADDWAGKLAYRSKLFRLTGPAIFNRVLFRIFPDIKAHAEMMKLMNICNDPAASALLKHLSAQLPSAEIMTPLADLHSIGNLHSWRDAR